MPLSSAVAMSINAYLSLVFFSNMDSYPRQSVVGQTYPIIEADALAEIEERVAQTPFEPGAMGAPSSWSALDSVLLPPSPAHKVRMVTPIHELGFGVPDHNGEILYPAGFTFNPLEHATLPGRIIVTLADRIEWAMNEAGAIDMVLVAGASPEQVLGRPGRSVFLLGELLAERLGVTHAPTIVSQVGAQLQLEEIEASTIPDDETLRTAQHADGSRSGGEK